MDTVGKMVRGYISQKDCLILVAVSMSGRTLIVSVLTPDDIENQGAARLARHYDKEGKRTIGIPSGDFH